MKKWKKSLSPPLNFLWWMNRELKRKENKKGGKNDEKSVHILLKSELKCGGTISILSWFFCLWQSHEAIKRIVTKSKVKIDSVVENIELKTENCALSLFHFAGSKWNVRLFWWIVEFRARWRWFFNKTLPISDFLAFSISGFNLKFVVATRSTNKSNQTIQKKKL